MVLLGKRKGEGVNKTKNMSKSFMETYKLVMISKYNFKKQDLN